MDIDVNKVLVDDMNSAKQYLQTVFKALKGRRYTSSSRKKKIANLYLELDGATTYETLVRSVYTSVYFEAFPVLEVQKLKQKRFDKIAKKYNLNSQPKKESNEWLLEKKQKLSQLSLLLNELETWEKEGEWQEGELFFSKLQSRVEPFDETICNKTNFSKSFQTYTNKLVTEASREGKEVNASYDALIGYAQDAEISFAADVGDWGQINAKLEESFKAGAWSKGSAQAKLSKTGLSTEIQAAIAIGAQLHLGGTLDWSKDTMNNTIGVQLAGEADLFAGARASGLAKLSVSATKGLNIALKADAFAGFEAKCKGTCAFKYDGEDLAKVQATAGVSFGVGGKLNGEIQASLFGPTVIDFEANATLGIGATVGTKTAIHVDKMALAAKSEFSTLVYLPTIKRGYKLDLINDDRKNRFYLTKSINYIKKMRDETQLSINTFQDTPLDQQALLM